MSKQLFIGTLAVALSIGGVFTYAVLRTVQEPAPLGDAAVVATDLGTSTTSSTVSAIEQGAAGSSTERAGASASIATDDERGEVEDVAEDDDGATTIVRSPPVKPVSTPEPVPTPTSKPAGITLADVAAHNSAQSCFMVIRGKVYDVTSYIGRHPGGNAILKGCGKDATSMFEGVRGHLKQATLNLLPGFYKGDLAG